MGQGPYDGGQFDYGRLLVDLRAEHAALDEIVSRLTDAQWDLDTPAPGWKIRHQMYHLTYFDDAARRAIVEPEPFSKHAPELMLAGGPDAVAADADALQPAELLAQWRARRGEMLAAFETIRPDDRVPWYGPAMSAASFVTARLEEVWGHGQDIRDTLGLPPLVSDRLRHIAFLGFRALPYAFVVHGQPVPASGLRVELEAPSGDTWEFGDRGAEGGLVRGSALDFCLVVTQRRHVDDTSLTVEGTVATEWIRIAQAFAGPAGRGRQPGLFPRVTQTTTSDG